MQPFHRLDGSTRYIIFQLVKKCLDLNLDNISFSYPQDNLNFYLNAQENYWELRVIQGDSQAVDVYWIIDDDSILYKYSK